MIYLVINAVTIVIGVVVAVRYSWRPVAGPAAPGPSLAEPDAASDNTEG